MEADFAVDGAPAPVPLRSAPALADGRFVVSGVPPRWKSLRLRIHRGPLYSEMDLGDAAGSLDLDLRLPATFRVGGIVIGAEDGRPLAGMAVRLEDRSARTDGLGRFEIPGLPASMAERPLPLLLVQGTGRRTLRRELPPMDRLDDLLLRVEPE